MNDCIVHCPQETVVVCSDKVAPSPDHIARMVTLLNEGYAFVGFYFFACVAFTKQLVRQIGFFDERFIGGECEDADYVVRLREADLAFYFTKEVPYSPISSSWDNSLSKQHFMQKWGTIHMAEAVRQMPEETYNYDLGPPQPRQFFPSSCSIDQP